MALEKKTLFERVEMDADGNLSLLLKKAVVDGDELVSESLHRVRVAPGDRVDTVLDAVSVHLQSMGFPAIPATVRSRATQVKTVVDGLPPVERPKPKGRDR